MTCLLTVDAPFSIEKVTFQGMLFLAGNVLILIDPRDVAWTRVPHTYKKYNLFVCLFCFFPGSLGSNRVAGWTMLSQATFFSCRNAFWRVTLMAWVKKDRKHPKPGKIWPIRGTYSITKSMITWASLGIFKKLHQTIRCWSFRIHHNLWPRTFPSACLDCMTSHKLIKANLTDA